MSDPRDKQSDSPAAAGDGGPPDQAAEQAVEQAVEHTDMELAYAGASRLLPGETGELALFGNLRREPVEFRGAIKHPLRLREALATIYAFVGSDFRYVPKDRTAYHAYRRMRNATATLSAWQAQQAYFQWLARNDPLAFLILDPIITVHPDQLMFEVFSKDEGAYARLAIDTEQGFEVRQSPTYGTTNIDFSEQLYQSILQFRDYRAAELHITQQEVQLKDAAGTEVVEKQIKLPDSWIRGLLQVQSAAMLPRDALQLAPMDLYNALRHLRFHADKKGQRRGLRVELVPGEQPRLVLEPWEEVIEGTADVYRGTQAKVVRIWGRRRLMLLRRMLPLIDRIELQLTGSGLPSFWVLRAGEMTLTLALTGFTSANWSQAASFDLLLPRKTQSSAELKKVVKHLSGVWRDDRDGISKATKLTGAALLETLQLGCQQGQLIYDLAADLYRLRPLTNAPLDWGRLEYRNRRERVAHDLLARRNAVSIVSENRIHGEGLEITGKVSVAEDKREYRPQMLLSEDGYVSRAECTCNAFRKQGLKDGPCACLVALRLAQAIAETKRRSSDQSRRAITVETRTYSRRRGEVEELYQLSLQQQWLKLRWGVRGETARVQQLRFPDVGQARDEYLARVDRLESAGYLDASAQ